MTGAHAWHAPPPRRWHGIDIRHVFAGGSAAAVVAITITVVITASARPPAPSLSALPAPGPASVVPTTLASPPSASATSSAPRVLAAAPRPALRAAPPLRVPVALPLAMPVALTTPPAAPSPPAASSTSSARTSTTPPTTPNGGILDPEPTVFRWTADDVTALVPKCSGQGTGLVPLTPLPAVGTVRADPPAWPCVPLVDTGPPRWTAESLEAANAACGGGQVIATQPGGPATPYVRVAVGDVVGDPSKRTCLDVTP